MLATVKLPDDFSFKRTCGKCGRIGHNARTCQLEPAPWDKFGVEVEGFWRHENRRRLTEARTRIGAREVGDGSLNVDDDDYFATEIPTAPGTLGEVIRWVADIYPDGRNDSAGMHVHVSFRDKVAYTLLATPEFHRYHAASWKAWGEKMGIFQSSNFWSRLAGRNQYCLTPESTYQAGQTEILNVCNTRYSQVNYQAYQEHTTIEFRLLPLFKDARIAVAAIEHLAAMIDDFLTNHAPALPECTANIPGPQAYQLAVIGAVEIPEEWGFALDVAADVPEPMEGSIPRLDAIEHLRQIAAEQFGVFLYR
jgi:hypothetical protein